MCLPVIGSNADFLVANIAFTLSRLGVGHAIVPLLGSMIEHAIAEVVPRFRTMG